MNLPRLVAAEALGTAMLVATVVGSGIMAETLSTTSPAVALLGNTIATAGMLYVLITIFGPVSGAHFNPAISLVFAVRGELAWRSLAPYIVAQVAGGIAGTLLAHAMFRLPLIQLSGHARSGASQWLSEFTATFSLVLAILGTLRARPEAVPTAIALAITAGYWFTASTSFANPAVTLARALSDTFSGIAPVDAPAFVMAQTAGALAALGVCHRIFGWRPPALEAGIADASGLLAAEVDQPP